MEQVGHGGFEKIIMYNKIDGQRLKEAFDQFSEFQEFDDSLFNQTLGLKAEEMPVLGKKLLMCKEP